MTSTNHFVGMPDEGKLSSKVMKPPGGACSDIFGTSAPPPENTPRRKNHMASDIFGGGTTVTLTTPLKQRAPQDTTTKLFGEVEAVEQTKKKNYNKSNVLETDKEEDKEKNKENVEKEEEEENEEEARNPITGEGCEPEKEEEQTQKPAPRGRIPPGGYSSKLW